MRVKLKKLELLDETAIEAMDRDAAIATLKLWRPKLEQYQGILFRIRKRCFGSSSERTAREPAAGEEKTRGETKKLPSERYPNAPVREEEISFAAAPACEVCGAGAMPNSGMTEDSEYLDVDAKEFSVVRQRRHKHRCAKCHSSIVTAPLPPRVVAGGSYSDALIVDATLSKYCDLIPMERYCAMAARGGLSGLPPQSLIQATFDLAEFLRGVYALIKKEALQQSVLLADETPHRMLEGDAKRRWYLWDFSGGYACFFECHDTRSGEISSDVLVQSSCDVLVSDAYSGYKKSVTVANELRAKDGKKAIQQAYCNAHARREFKNTEASEESKFMVAHYDRVYAIEASARGLAADGILAKRATMRPHFEAMRAEALQKVATYSSKSGMGTAYNYFLKHYDGLTLFLGNAGVPIDNNASERLLRSPVVGRKTWYGTHSRAGADAAVVHFTIVETCKLNGVNPRQYYQDMIANIHHGRPLLTPRQYKEQGAGNSC